MKTINVFGKFQIIIKRAPKFDEADEFWVQRMRVPSISGDRLNFFSQFVKGKKVLHVGCTDHPVFRPENNLHIKMAAMTDVLHGLDLDLEGIEVLKKYVDQPYFNSFADSQGPYDVCIVPETIEHVDNVKDFLKEMATVDARQFIVTGPNAFCQLHMNHCVYSSEDNWIEGVHQDHNAWYSPYTLMNVIRKYSGLKVTGTYVVQHGTMVCCVCEKE
jgi:hypothetical protein